MGFDLKNRTGGQALRLAREVSGLTLEAVSERSGISLPTIKRYFDEHDTYLPSLSNIPPLCRALENTIIMDWLAAQLEDLSPSEGIHSVQQLLRGVNRIGQEAGDVCRVADRVAEDGFICPVEAQELAGELKDVEEAARAIRENLQPVAGHMIIGGKLHKVLLSEDNKAKQ
ncbi:MAG: helix-turn-helix domain-containing protein [Acidobacteriota bacterium]